MYKIYYELKKHLIIYFLFVKNSLIGYMEYRANFYAALTMEIFFLCSKITYVLVFYGSGIKIDGISPDEIMIFVGTFLIMTGIYTGLFMDNFYRMPQHIRTGTLDMYITKPISLQFMTTMRHINFALPIPNLLAGIILVVMAWKKLNIPISCIMILGYLTLLICGTAIAYSLFLIPQIFSFWTIKSRAITEIADRSWDLNNMPMMIYSKWMQRIGIFIIPVFFITNFPALFLLSKLSFNYLAWVVIGPILFFIIVRSFWNYGIKNYISASS